MATLVRKTLTHAAADRCILWLRVRKFLATAIYVGYRGTVMSANFVTTLCNYLCLLPTQHGGKTLRYIVMKLSK